MVRPHWLGVRLQMSDGCYWEFNSHVLEGIFSSKFIFPEFICVTGFMSDFIIVKSRICVTVIFVLDKKRISVILPLDTERLLNFGSVLVIIRLFHTT